MSLRRAGTLSFALALTACHSVTQEQQPADFIFASFDSTTGAIPLPNDLALQANATATPSAHLPPAQIEVLNGYIKSGGFPSDVEADITIPFHAVTWNAGAGASGQYEPAAAPTLDDASVTPSTVVLLRVDVTPPAAVTYDKVIAAGKLTLRPPLAADGTRRWAGGRYVVAVRGGASGVKAGGKAINPDTGIALAIPNVDVRLKENQPPGGLTPELAAQVNGLRTVLWNALPWCNVGGTWNPPVNPATGQVDPGLCAGPISVPTKSAFDAVNGVFPYADTAVVATFSIDKSAHVALDSGAGQAPFPSDFLLDFNVAHCPTGVAPCVAHNPAFGPAAAGLTTLDGFSTTALLLAPLTGAVDPATITRNNVHLFDLSTSPFPTWVKDLASTLPSGVGASYVTQPPDFSQSVEVAPGVFKTLTKTVALAPAVLADLGIAKFAMPPLKEKHQYAVVVTRRVLNADGSPMTRGAAANIFLSTTQPLYGPDGHGNTVPYVQGADLATAQGLQTLRDGLKPFLDALGTLTGGLTNKDDVAMVYTITTQSVTGTSVSLGAAPYSIETHAGAAIFAGTGLTAGALPGFYSLAFNSADIIDKATGALRPTLAGDLASPSVLPTLLHTLHAVVAVPAEADVPDCGAGFPAGLKCAKLVIVGHGVNGDNTTTYALAGTLAAQGFIVAGIDFPLHGERNWCGADADCVVPGGADGTCDKTGAFAGGRSINDFTASAGQGDAVRPGVCANGSVPRQPAASRYLIGTNFFRTRDTFRQNIFDVSALTLAVARPPAPYPQPAGNPLSAVLPPGVIVDPREIYYEGISWGSINGTSVLATNSRITRGALSVGGGTIVDIFTTSPSFQSGVDALFPALIPGYTRPKITPGDPAFDPAIAAQYIQVLSLAKWILDPADPLNYAQHLTDPTRTLPNLLAAADGSVAQSAKSVFAQIALGDTVVPNATNDLLDLLIGGPITLYQTDATPPGNAPHGMLATTAQVQLDAALYLVDPVNNVPPAIQSLPSFP